VGRDFNLRIASDNWHPVHFDLPDPPPPLTRGRWAAPRRSRAWFEHLRVRLRSGNRWPLESRARWSRMRFATFASAMKAMSCIRLLHSGQARTSIAKTFRSRSAQGMRWDRA
jgi:hypothetical protein